MPRLLGSPLSVGRPQPHLPCIPPRPQLTGLTEQQKIERDVYVYRSYIELGSYEVGGGGRAGGRVQQAPEAPGRQEATPALTIPPLPLAAQLVLSEIGASSPMALQAVKELALYLKDGAQREAVLGRVGEWLTDMSCTGNATVLLVAGLVYLLEENYVEALKCCHSGQSLEMWVEPRRAAGRLHAGRPWREAPRRRGLHRRFRAFEMGLHLRRRGWEPALHWPNREADAGGRVPRAARAGWRCACRPTLRWTGRTRRRRRSRPCRRTTTTPRSRSWPPPGWTSTWWVQRQGQGCSGGGGGVPVPLRVSVGSAARRLAGRQGAGIESSELRRDAGAGEGGRR